MDIHYVPPSFDSGDTIVISELEPNAFHRVHFVVLQLQPDVFTPAVLATRHGPVGADGLWRLIVPDDPEEVIARLNIVYYYPRLVGCCLPLYILTLF
jgi:hypothetical protein